MVRRIHGMMILFLLLFSLLAGRLAWFQVVKGHELAQQAAAMRSRKIEIKEYPRGDIVDRNLLPLTGTRVSSALYCIPQEVTRQVLYSQSEQDHSDVAYTNRSLPAVAAEIARALNPRRQADVLTCLEESHQSGSTFVRLASDLSQDEIRKVNALNLPGLIVAPEIKRYGENAFCVHLLGYVGGEPDYPGQAGLERAYDSILKQNSQPEELTSIADARGAAIQGLMFKIKSQTGDQRSTVVTTLDKRVQALVEESMNRRVKRGAVVVMDVHSKEILALASRPAFNPYTVEDVISDNNQQGPLNNRAFMRYYPGSLFKLAVASAALEEKTVNENSRFNCTGQYVFNDQVSIGCWQEEGHGAINFRQAFALSCNPAFIETGLKLGRSKLLEYVERMHLTDEKVIGYPAVNTESFVRINPGEPALGNASIGQEGVMLSPLQLCSLVSTIADDGKWSPPRLVLYSMGRDGVKKAYPAGNKEQVISSSTARRVQALMKQVVDEGTGKSATLQEVAVAGKTGTSQTGGLEADGSEILDTWFAGYFPAGNPRWAIVVLVEEGKTGAESAAPVFKDISAGMLDLF